MAKSKMKMKNSENIDKIFSEGLYKYERQPRPQAWEKLEARLQKPKSKVLPIWWKYASAASVALLLGIGGYWISNKKPSSIEEVAVNQKPVNIKKPTQIIEKEIINQVVKVEGNLSKKTLYKSIEHHEMSENKQFAPLPLQQIIRIEEIKQIAKIPIIESKKAEEQNTIVLVLENTKPKVEEETIVLNMVETKPEVVAQSDLNDGAMKKETRLSKIWQQLKRAKNGENVNWSEVGIKPQKMLARADAKIENVLTKGEGNEK
jgi:hypothetical protein